MRAILTAIVLFWILTAIMCGAVLLRSGHI